MSNITVLRQQAWDKLYADTLDAIIAYRDYMAAGESKRDIDALIDAMKFSKGTDLPAMRLYVHKMNATHSIFVTKLLMNIFVCCLAMKGRAHGEVIARDDMFQVWDDAMLSHYQGAKQHQAMMTSQMDDYIARAVVLSERLNSLFGSPRTMSDKTAASGANEPQRCGDISVH